LSVRVSPPCEDKKKVQRNGTHEWMVAVFVPGVRSEIHRFATEEEAQAFYDKQAGPREGAQA
jgi:hypothetical protein